MLAEIIPKIAGFIREDQPYYPRPSSAGPDRCIRSMVYHGLGIERTPMPGRARLVLDDSSWHEELTADWLRQSPFKLHSEQMSVTINDKMTGLSLTGHIDGIITDMLQIDRLWEHKAINHFTFQKYWGGEVPLDYLTQVCIYIKGLQESNPEVNEAILLIKNKNTAQYMEFRIIYYSDDTAIIESRSHSNGESCKMELIYPDILRSAFDKFHIVNGYIEKKTLPKRQYFIDDWHCEYCGWYRTCWQDFKKEFQELKTDTMLTDDVADMVRYYKETGAQIKELTDENKALGNKIKLLMDELNTREGRAGEYLLKRALIIQNRLDSNLLTEEEKNKATKQTMFERLYISNLDKKGEQNGDGIQE